MGPITSGDLSTKEKNKMAAGNHINYTGQFLSL